METYLRIVVQQENSVPCWNHATCFSRLRFPLLESLNYCNKNFPVVDYQNSTSSTRLQYFKLQQKNYQWRTSALTSLATLISMLLFNLDFPFHRFQSNAELLILQCASAVNSADAEICDRERIHMSCPSFPFCFVFCLTLVCMLRLNLKSKKHWCCKALVVIFLEICCINIFRKFGLKSAFYSRALEVWMFNHWPLP